MWVCDTEICLGVFLWSSHDGIICNNVQIVKIDVCWFRFVCCFSRCSSISLYDDFKFENGYYFASELAYLSHLKTRPLSLSKLSLCPSHLYIQLPAFKAQFHWDQISFAPFFLKRCAEDIFCPYSGLESIKIILLLSKNLPISPLYSTACLQSTIPLRSKFSPVLDKLTDFSNSRQSPTKIGGSLKHMVNLHLNNRILWKKSRGILVKLFKTLVLGKVSKNKIRTDGCHCSFPQRAQQPNSSSRKIAKYTKFSASVVPTPDFPQNFQFGEFLASSHIGYLCSSLEGSRLT